MTVEISLKETSQVIVHNNVINAYTKGNLYCVYVVEQVVYKYPINNIWRIKEDK